MGDSIFSSFTSLFAMTDEQAMWRVQMHDDAQAFAQLVRRWEGPIQRLCSRMTGDTHRGEDLAQETFVRLFSKRKDYRPQGRFSTFLWRVAINLCYDELRKIRRRSESPLETENNGECVTLHEFPADEPSPDQTLLVRERNELVHEAVMRLPETYRIVVVLRHYENLKFREIAEVLGVPEGTVKSRMTEALMQLTRLLRHSVEGKSPTPISNLCKTPTKKSEESLRL
jgi:RNA polymerase sigma-70 factor, ECF subfamily